MPVRLANSICVRPFRRRASFMRRPNVTRPSVPSVISNPSSCSVPPDQEEDLAGVGCNWKRGPGGATAGGPSTGSIGRTSSIQKISRSRQIWLKTITTDLLVLCHAASTKIGGWGDQLFPPPEATWRASGGGRASPGSKARDRHSEGSEPALRSLGTSAVRKRTETTPQPFPP